MLRIFAFLYKSLVIFMLGFLLVLYGFLSDEDERALSPLLRMLSQGGEAAKSLFVLEVIEKRSAQEISGPFTTGGVTIHNKERVQDGVTFMNYYDGDAGEYRAQLIDIDGNQLHQWRIPFDEYPDLSVSKDVNIALSKKHKSIHGYHVDADGNLLLILEITSLLKLDKDSKLLWKLDIAAHHSMDVAEDGSIWILNRKGQPRATKTRPYMLIPHWEDQVMQISQDGEVIQTFSILDSIFNSNYQGILYAGGNPRRSLIKYDDPLHTNDIEILSEQEAIKFEGVQAGDILLSLRTLNTLIVLDKESKLIKWSMTGPFVRQHDPDVDKEGNIYLFDNRTGISQRDYAHYLPDGQAFGYTRILKIDPASRKVETEFEGSKEVPFFSSIMGRVQVLENNNLLIVEPEGGRVFEVDPESKEIVWEYRNLVEPGWVGRISDADRYPRDAFNFLAKEE